MNLVLSFALAFVVAVIAGSVAVYFGASEFLQGAIFGGVLMTVLLEFADTEGA